MSSPGDLTPESGGPTDVAPLGRGGPTPTHERTGAEDAALANWDAIAAMPEFQALVQGKNRFIIRYTIFFLAYFLLLLLLVGFAPGFMKTEVLGHANLAYVFGFSQFIMAWILAAIYLRTAAGWDRQAAEILSRASRS